MAGTPYTRILSPKYEDGKILDLLFPCYFPDVGQILLLKIVNYTLVLLCIHFVANGKRQVTELFSRKPLKSPRLISTTVFTTNVVLNSEGISAHTMQWGQLIAHEFTQLAEAKG